MKNPPAERAAAAPAPDALPTLKRVVRKPRRPLAALRPLDAQSAGLEARVGEAVQTVLQEEIQRMTRRVHARLPGVIARLARVGEP